MTVASWLDQRAASHRDHPALVGNAGTLTYGELRARAGAAATRLREHGVNRGAHVGVLLSDGIELAIVLHALMRCEAVIVPLGLRLTTSELAAQLSAAGADLLIADEPGLRLEPSLRGGAWNGRIVDVASLRGFLAAAAAPPIDLAARHCVLFTSGSTGRAKGVALAYGNHLWSAFASAVQLGMHPDDRWLACLPFCHIGGLSILLRSVIYGTTAVVHDGFDPAAVNRAIDEQRITIVSVVANMLQRMLAERGPKPYPPSLRCVLMGGGPAPRSLLELCAEREVPLAPTYGLTEASSQVATRQPSRAPCPADAVGSPLLGTEVCLTEGRTGEILVRGPTVGSGYVNVAEPLTDPDGWLHTGDLGYLDDDGELHVVGRRDDMIVSGGENVHPAEVEAALQSHPGVLEACVFGVADERWGRAVHARVRLAPDAAVTADELRAHLRTLLAGYKVPRLIERVEDFPRTAAGKIIRPRR